jgi:glyoxylase-like metal-dependent hydrolase (beta-lactamase superfamily II)
MTYSLLRCSLLLALLTLLTVIPSQPIAAQARDAGARMERVADGVYAIIHDAATEDWPNSNTGVVVGDNGVLVVDATYLPSRAKADIALIRTVTDKPVRYVVISHLHRDHTGGTSAYREAFPNVSVISGPETREFIAINRAATARAGAASGSPLRARLAALERQLSAGHDSSGRALSAQETAALAKNVSQRRIEITDLEGYTVVVPDVTVKTELVLHLGARTVVIQDRGRANSPDDVTAFVADQRVLFTGDIVVEAPIPYLGATWPVEWARVLRDIEASAPSAVVPGHGPVMHDVSYVRSMRELIESVDGQVAALLKQGLPLDQIQQRVDVATNRAAVPAWNSADVDADWRGSVRALVERAWHELRGLD